MKMNLARLVLLALVAATTVRAAEITGTVRSVTGDVATVAMNGDVMPPNGARAEFFFKIPGSDEEISVASGSVLRIDRGDLLVKIENATGSVESGHLARFAFSPSSTPAASLPATSPTPAPTQSPPVETTQTSPTQTPTQTAPTQTPSQTSPTPTPTEADRQFLEAARKFDSHDLIGAMAGFTKALELDPTNAKSYANRGAIYLTWKQPQQALAELNEAIRLKPDLVIAHVYRGYCYFALGQHKRAIENYDEALRLDPKNASAYNGRGISQNQLGRTKVAIEDFSQAIAADPNYVEAYQNRAICYKAVGKSQLAKQDLATIRELKAAANPSAKPTPVPPKRNK